MNTELAGYKLLFSLLLPESFYIYKLRFYPLATVRIFFSLSDKKKKEKRILAPQVTYGNGHIHKLLLHLVTPDAGTFLYSYPKSVFQGALTILSYLHKRLANCSFQPDECHLFHQEHYNHQIMELVFVFSCGDRLAV